MVKFDTYRIMDYVRYTKNTRLDDLYWHSDWILTGIKIYLTTVTGSDDILYLPCVVVGGGIGIGRGFHYVTAIVFKKEDVHNYENILKIKKRNEIVNTSIDVMSFIEEDELIIYVSC